MNTLVELFATSGIGMAFGVAYTMLMAAAAGMDLRYRRISNGLALAVLLLGALFAAISIGPHDATVRVLGGVGTGLAVWLPLWLLGKLGAGDVKFFAAACAWLGPRLALDAALASAILGGVLALGWLLWHARSKRVVTLHVSGAEVERRNDSDGSRGVRTAGERSVALPYGVAMATGLAITAWFPHLMH